MKTISFFSVKGGTGKTTFNILLASWLRYQKGKRVCVMDLDGPEYSLSVTRERELIYLRDQGVDLPADWLYPVLRFQEEDPMNEVRRKIRALERDTDYLIVDFGGSFKVTDPVRRFVQEGLLDLVLLPVELDGMIIASAKSLSTVLQQMGQDTLMFFNKVHGREKPELYEAFGAWFAETGLELSQGRVKNTIKLQRDCDRGTNFLRSTVGFPQKEMEKVNPGLIQLFEEIWNRTLD